MDANTLSVMFQNHMGPQAAYALQGSLQADKQAQAEQLRGAQLQNDQTAAMNPLNQQFRQGQIDEQSAQLPGLVGQSKTLASQGDTEEATTAAKIAQRISSLGNQVGVDGMQKMAREGAILGQASAALSQYPPALHKQVLGKIMQQYGADPNSPLAASISQLPDDKVATGAATLSKGMVMASSEYLTNAAALASHERVATGNNQATLGAARINADSRMAVAQTRAAAVKHMSTDQAIAFLEMQNDRTPEESQQLVNLKKQKLQERAAGANPVPAAVMNLPTPLDNAANAAGGGASAPTTTPTGDVGTMAKEAWGSYDPASYVYRVGPNGKLQRKPK